MHDLTTIDRHALNHAHSLFATYPRLEGEGDGGEGGDGAEDGGDPTPLQQQALDAIEQLKATGAEIPEALSAAVNELRDARSEAASYRTQLRDVQEEQNSTKTKLDGIAKALGLNGDGDDADPDQLQQALTQREAENRRLRVVNALGDVLAKHNADPLLTRAVLREQGVLDELDPDDDEFADKLDTVVKTAVETNPKLVSTGQPGAADQGARNLDTAVTEDDLSPAARMRAAYANSSKSK